MHELQGIYIYIVCKFCVSPNSCGYKKIATVTGRFIISLHTSYVPPCYRLVYIELRHLGTHILNNTGHRS